MTGRPEELIADLRVAAEMALDCGEITDDVWYPDLRHRLRALADALEAAGDGPFVIDASGRVLGTLEPQYDAGVSMVAHPLYRLRPSLTEEPTDD